MRGPVTKHPHIPFLALVCLASIARAQDRPADNVLDRRERLASVVVTGNRAGGGAVDLPHDLTIEPVSAPELTERST